jgi:hypothetical protein
MSEMLKQHVGKRVALIFSQGFNITGKVLNVGSGYVAIDEGSGRQPTFVALDKIVFFYEEK